MSPKLSSVLIAGVSVVIVGLAVAITLLITIINSTPLQTETPTAIVIGSPTAETVATEPISPLAEATSTRSVHDEAEATAEARTPKPEPTPTRVVAPTSTPVATTTATTEPVESVKPTQLVAKLFEGEVPAVLNTAPFPILVWNPYGRKFSCDLEQIAPQADGTAISAKYQAGSVVPKGWVGIYNPALCGVELNGTGRYFQLD